MATPKRMGRRRAKASNKFAVWVDRSGFTYDDLAELLECSRSRISKLRSGSERPGLDLATRIAEKSNGAVPTSAWGGK